MTNEAGISINGDDYAGYHAFDADGRGSPTAT